MVPIGYRFVPTDVELTLHYLRSMVSGQPFSSNGAIEVFDIYSMEPLRLPGASDIIGNKGCLYFFVRMKKKTEKGCRPDRRAGNGFWRASVKDDYIWYRNTRVGHKKSLSYHIFKDQNQTSKNGIKTNWIMHEYGLKVDPTATLFEQWTLCKISHTGRSPMEGCPCRTPSTSTRDITVQQVAQHVVNDEGVQVAMETNVQGATEIREMMPSTSTAWPEEEFIDIDELLSMLDESALETSDRIMDSQQEQGGQLDS